MVFMLLYARTERTRRPETTKAGLIYLRIADPRHRQDAFRASWPPWLPALEASARANARSVTYYFIGAPANVTCVNCVEIPLDLAGLRARVEKYLGVTDMEIKSVKNKICDLKPMWPVLFPEVSARHEWVGFADADVLFGDLAAEVDLLTASDDLLVPSSWHPYPLANGNFMLFRSTARVLQAFRGAGWREAVRSPGYSVFDEWHGRGSATNFGHALLEMHLNGKLRPKPTSRLFLQDAVSGGRALMERPAALRATWARGRLRVAYRGPCYCSKDVVPQFAIAHCSECVFRAGATPDVTVARDLEVLAYHMLYTKPWIGRKYAVAPALRDCEAFALWKSETSREHHLECVDAPR